MNCRITEANGLDYSPKGRIGLAILTIALFVSISLGLYFFDNQFLENKKQPEFGILTLSQEDLSSCGMYHLVKGWEYFPNVELTPQELADHPESYHSEYINLENARLTDPHNGTYRLTISVPPKSNYYALRLPTIYSDFKLYLDNYLFFTKEIPADASCYGEKHNERQLSFPARGEFQILISFSNQTAPYSGFSHPPAFGLAREVEKSRNIQLAFYVAVETIAVSIFILSVALFIRSRQIAKFYKILIGLFAIMFYLYPAFKITPPSASNTLRLMTIISYFGCYWAQIFAYSHHFQWDDGISRYLKIFSSICLGGIIIYCVSVPIIIRTYNTYWIGQLIWLFDLISILNSILLTYRTIKTDGERSAILTAASVSMWTFSLCDIALYKNYYPVSFASPFELGILFMIIGVITVDYMDVAEANYFKATTAERFKSSERAIRTAELHYDQIQEQMAEIHRIRHDLRHHMVAVETLIDQNEIEELKKYVASCIQKAEPLIIKPIQFSQYPAIDSLLTYYYQQTNKIDAEFKTFGQLPRMDGTLYIDVCSVLGNMIENAYEALQRQSTDSQRYIHIYAKNLHNQLVIEVINSTDDIVRFSGRLTQPFVSMKGKQRLGIGTMSIRMIAERLHGYANFTAEKGCFKAAFMIPYHQSKEIENEGSKSDQRCCDDDFMKGK